MSVATASPAASPVAVGGVGTAAAGPPKTRAPSHSILRPCNAKGIPIGPAVIAPPKPTVMTHTPKVHRSASITVGALKNTGRIPVRGGGSAFGAPPPTPTAVSPAQPAAAAAAAAAAPPAQATIASPASAVGTHPGSSTDSLGSSEPSMSSPVTAESTLASSAASNDLWEEESAGTSDSTPRSSMLDGVSPKIRFGHLPERPAELRRRNSITLGVLARKNMLHAQGSTGGAQKTSSGAIKVMMTDAEWEEYQRKFAAKSNQSAPVDIGQVMSTSAKKLFSKFSRRGSNASVASTGSNVSQVSTGVNRARSDSATSGAASVSPRVGPVDVAPAIVEEEEPHSAPGSPGGPGGAFHMSSMPRRGSLDALGGGAGDETPRIGRSPSPPGMHHLPPGHRQRSASPPPHTEEDDDDEEGDDDEDFSNEDDEEAEEYAHDDADGQYEETHSHSTAAALGFELSDYNQSKRPSWSSDHARNNNTGHAVHQIPGFHHANDPASKQVAAAANEISSHPRLV